MNKSEDLNTEVWTELCDYIEFINENEIEAFEPAKVIKESIYKDIYSLPKSISKLKRVKKILMHGSNLEFIPPEIGQMDSLELLGTYTSRQLNWFPYELVDCKNLNQTWISLRCLYGNINSRKEFPNLNLMKIKYSGDEVKCSICKKSETYETIDQYWITLKITNDVIPLLANICSDECKSKLGKPPEYYIPYPHKGGPDLVQPPNHHEIRLNKMKLKEDMKNEN